MATEGRLRYTRLMAKRTRLSPQAARARLELIAPDAASALGDIMDYFHEVVTSEATVERDGKEVPLYSLRDKLAASKEVRGAAPIVLDRGGAPPLRQVQVDSTHRQLEGKDERQLLAEVSEMILRLSPEDKALLTQMNPNIQGMLGPGEDDPSRPN